MKRRSTNAKIACESFEWKLFTRDGVYYADSRGRPHRLGKHSLNTRDREEALRNLRVLDRRLAVQKGLARPETSPAILCPTIADGWQLHLEHCGRPQILGGISAGSQKRYRAVRDKHGAFCARRGIVDWSRIDKASVEAFGHWMAADGYAPRTILLELNTVASVVKRLIETRRLPESSRFTLGLSKIDSCDAYCYSREQVAAMVDRCRSREDLVWLGDVLVALATTGMRIGELAALRWGDVDLPSGTIQLRDERHSSRKQRLGTARTVKGKRGRTIPIHPALQEVLARKGPQLGGAVFLGPRGGRLKPDLVRVVLIRDVIEPLKARFPTPDGELGFEHGRVHTLRHYFVSEAFRQGATEAQIMAWVGHRDSKMVAHYRHLRPQDSQRMMQAIDFFGSGNAPDGPVPAA
jgi:site-specific recombinase XerD